MSWASQTRESRPKRSTGAYLWLFSPSTWRCGFYILALYHRLHQKTFSQMSCINPPKAWNPLQQAASHSSTALWCSSSDWRLSAYASPRIRSPVDSHGGISGLHWPQGRIKIWTRSPPWAPSAPSPAHLHSVFHPCPCRTVWRGSSLSTKSSHRHRRQSWGLGCAQAPFMPANPASSCPLWRCRAGPSLLELFARYYCLRCGRSIAWLSWPGGQGCYTLVRRVCSNRN